MRKKTTYILLLIIATVALATSCSDVKREPSRVYMPDMAYSRAYETYSVSPEDKQALEKKGIHFSNMPVPGTIKRGELLPFTLSKDKEGDSTNYVASKMIKSPITEINGADSIESERLYLVNCGICHGQKLDGNGPLYKGGEGPFHAAPKNFMGDAGMIAMPEGQMFYSATYGKNKMGSYASQLDSRQRWLVIHYIKSKQAAKAGAAAKSDSTAAKK